MAVYEKAFFKTVMIHEGGKKVTNEDFDGHVTKFGITQYLLDMYGYDIDVKIATEKFAKVFFKTHFWDELHCDQIVNSSVACSLFDFAINQGHKSAIIRLQQAVNAYNDCQVLKCDGIIGRLTLGAVNSIADHQHFCKLFTKYKMIEYSCDLRKKLKKKTIEIIEHGLLEDHEKIKELNAYIDKWFNINHGWINRTFDND